MGKYFRTYPVIGADAVGESLLLLAHILITVIPLQAQHKFVVQLPAKHTEMKYHVLRGGNFSTR
jgi:hypothetical protein